MPKVHFLNVDPGDCSIIEHGSERISMIDICDGFTPEEIAEAINSSTFKGGDWTKLLVKGANGNFRMKENLTNPLDYLNSIGVKDIFRFILTHPDMDHMDGLKALSDHVSISNFWDTGVEKEKPDFAGSPYREEDWDQYIKFKSGTGTRPITRLSGEYFQFANRNENDEPGGDGLYILAPNSKLVEEANSNGDVNDASYVLLYRSAGGRVLLPGDAHDKTWEHILDHYESDVANCSVMIAPHHGRDSGRSYDFLDRIRPKLTLFGNAPSEHLAYDKWNQRDLPFITSNQAGNIVLECENGKINVFIQNYSFAQKYAKYAHTQNSQGYYLYDVILPTEEGQSVKKQSSTNSLASLYKN